MKYHDNDVYLLNNRFYVAGGTYTITDYCITEGQDPNHKISTNQTLRFGTDGKLTFEVGQKGSKEVATWFTQRIPKTKNTFEENPQELNFAFIGTLKNTLYTNEHKTDSKNFVFERVAIAQGSTTANNKWWFGADQTPEGATK